MNAAACILALVVGVMFIVTVRRLEEALLAEQERVSELLRLLEAKAAPNEVAAFLNPFPEPEPRQYLVSEDGLVIVEVDDDGS